jgi:hypothetical protein
VVPTVYAESFNIPSFRRYVALKGSDRSRQYPTAYAVGFMGGSRPGWNTESFPRLTRSALIFQAFGLFRPEGLRSLVHISHGRRRLQASHAFRVVAPEGNKILLRNSFRGSALSAAVGFETSQGSCSAGLSFNSPSPICLSRSLSRQEGCSYRTRRTCRGSRRAFACRPQTSWQLCGV